MIVYSRTLAGLLAALACCCAVAPAAVLAQKADSAIVIGQSARIWSQTLQEERRLFIYLPPHYAQSRQRYPVLYLLDAEAHFYHTVGILQFLASANQRVPEMIIVGVTNTQRERDFTPQTSSSQRSAEYPDAGGADSFLGFLVDELMPWVETRYRTEPYRALAGHSFGGLFAVHALLTRPQAFQAYLAMSPSLWFDSEAALARAEAGLGKVPAGPHFLRLSWADDEPIIRAPTQQLVDWLRANPPAGVQWAYRYYKGDDHMSTPHRALYDGLEELFAGWRLHYEIDGVDQELTLPAVEAHYAALSQRFGYVIRPSAEAIDRVAFGLLQRKESAAALELFRRNLREYPFRADAYRSMGVAMEELGRPEEALSWYEQALRLAIDDESPYMDKIARYRAAVARLARKQGSSR